MNVAADARRLDRVLHNSTIDIPNDDFVDGTIDEVRIEAVARSASWIAAQYESMVDTFASFAMIETR